MNNTYDAQAGGYPAGAPGPAAPGPSRLARTKRFRWGAGITLAGFLAGGAIALAAVSGTAGGATLGAGSAASTQAAELNSALSTAASNSATVPAARLRWALARLRRFGGVDGTATFHNKTGFHALSFERGVIESVSGSDVVVKAPDGTTWTWLIVNDTVVRRSGAKTSIKALSPGEAVFAGGPVVSGARDARLIIIRAGQPAGSTSAPGSLS